MTLNDLEQRYRPFSRVCFGAHHVESAEAGARPTVCDKNVA